ncbi:MAG: PrsW family intramembrane metalloprotease [Anaerolineae bacterium]|nr:PrsW family intramembrane metalloprotease [Anaerolineae bacterium]
MIRLEEDGGGVTLPSSSPSLRQTLGLVAAIAGVTIAALILVTSPLLLVIVYLLRDGALDGPTIQQGLALTVLGTGLGSASFVVGWRVWKNLPSYPFNPRRPGLLWLIFIPLLMAGFTLSLLDLSLNFLLPPLNTLVMILLPLLVLSIVGKLLRGRGGTLRDVTAGLVGGASLGTSLALVLELAAVASLVAAAIALGLIPGGMGELEALLEQFQDPGILDDPQALLALLSPAAMIAALLFVSTLTPLIEEATKTLGVGLAGRWLRPTPARAFLLGVASGAGFSLAENLMNGAVISEIWGPGVLMRLAATLMHCATSGLMGWGWGELWVQRRPLRTLLAFVGATGIHGTWNGLAFGVALAGIVGIGFVDNTVLMGVLGLLVLAMASTLLLLAAATLVGILWAAWSMGKAPNPSQYRG